MSFRRINSFYGFKDWIIALGLVSLGYVFSAKSFFPGKEIYPGVLILSLFLAYGYSFNRLCDKPIEVSWRKKCLFVLCPLILGFTLILYYFPKFSIIVLLAVCLNTAYSLPGVSWKNFPVLSVLINMYLFGIIFLFGAFLKTQDFAAAPVLMSVYMAGFFIPAQLLHEMSHAKEDNRYDYIFSRRKEYMAVLILAVLLQVFFAACLYSWFRFKPLFIFSSLLFWAALVYYFFRTGIWPDFSVGKAAVLRSFFKKTGIALGFFYFCSFIG